MRKLSSLTGIRAIAALWVVLFHLRYLFSFGVFNLIMDKGYLGVDFFFVLSGFIITYVHQKDLNHWPPGFADFRLVLRFIALRWARMLPVHYATLAFLVVVTWVRSLLVHTSFWTYHGLPGNSNDLILNLFNLQGWGLANHNSWNIPSWSISSEWFAYLLFPAIALLLLRQMKSLTSPLLLITICFWGFSSFVAVMHLATIDWTIHYSLIRVTLEFLIGCSLCTLFKKLPDNPWWPGALSGVSLLGLLTTFMLHGSDIFAVFFLTTLLLSLAYDNHWLSRFFSVRPMQYLGEISYSTYMMYAPLMSMFTSLEFHFHWTDHMPMWILLSSLILSQLGLANLMYFTVEKPARDLIRRYIIDRYLGIAKPKAFVAPVNHTKIEILTEKAVLPSLSVVATSQPLRLAYSREKERRQQQLQWASTPKQNQASLRLWLSVDEDKFSISSQVLPVKEQLRKPVESPPEKNEAVSIERLLEESPQAASQFALEKENFKLHLKPVKRKKASETVPSFTSWQPFSEEALNYEPFRRVLIRPKQSRH